MCYSDKFGTELRLLRQCLLCETLNNYIELYQVLKLQVQVRVRVLSLQVRVQVQVATSQVQVQVQVHGFRCKYWSHL